MTELKAYLDAGVLVAYGLKDRDRYYAKAKEVMDHILKGDYKGVVSVLSLLETMDVIRKRLVSKTSKDFLDRKSGQERKKYIEEESKKLYSVLVDCLTEAAKNEKILMVDFGRLAVSELLEFCNDLLVKTFGDIRFYPRCWQCDAEFEHYEYKGLGPVDAMHFNLAKKTPCDVFITTDKGFSGLDGDIAVSIL
jgi:predicted nucleic acid-binding protein